MKKNILFAITGVLLASVSYASSPVAEIGVGAWLQNPSGTAHYDAGSGVTGTNTFNATQNTSPYAWMFVKDPIPFLPNLRLEYTGIHATGQATGSWDGRNIYGSTSSVLNLKEYDVIPYYNLLNNTFWTTLDLGVDFKIININYSLDTKQSFIGYDYTKTSTIPLAYARLRVDIPSTNIGLESDAEYITDGSSTIYNVCAKIDYTFNVSTMIRPAIEFGYRVQKIKINESTQDVKTDMKFEGFYSGLMFSF